MATRKKKGHVTVKKKESGDMAQQQQAVIYGDVFVTEEWLVAQQVCYNG
jgi:hypothetical protein